MGVPPPKRNHAPAPIPLPPTLSLSPARPSNLPEADTLLRDGESILEDSRSWKQGKTYGIVKTYTRPLKHKAAAPAPAPPTPPPAPGAATPAIAPVLVPRAREEAWFCRVSEHPRKEASFDLLWEKLGQNKMLNEKEFIPEVRKVTLVKDISDNESIWSAYYSLPPPLSPRVFTVYQVVRLEEFPSHGRRGTIISIPVDLSSPADKNLAELEEKGVRGKYICVEQLRELQDGAVVEWRLATCGSPGGFIPKFLANKNMSAKIAEDVPHLLAWLRASQSVDTSGSDSSNSN